MFFRVRFDKVITGVATGLIMPVAGFLIFFLITRGEMTIAEFIYRVKETDKVTEVMSVSVFANIIAFLLFNRLDMLNASKGVLGITFAWAFAVFGIKLL